MANTALIDTAKASPRIASIDLLKLFAIATVLLGHSVEQLSADKFWDHPVWAFIYTFHMPLFMFLSGFFFRSSLRKGYLSVLKTRLFQLGVPSVTAFLLGLGIMKAFGVTAIADLCEISFAGFMNSVWFLKCLLFCIVIMWPTVKLLRKDGLAALVASVAILFVPGADVVNLNFMLPCFCLGMTCGLHTDVIERHRRALLWASALVFAVLLPFWSGRLTVYMVPTRVLSVAPFGIDLNNLLLTVYRLAIGLAGSLFCYLLSPLAHRLVAGTKAEPLITALGGATLGIYVVQTFLLEILVHTLGIYVPCGLSCVVAPLLALVELLACYGVVCLLRRSRITRALFLGERNRN